MDIVNLCCYGEGNYSGASYEENIAISKDTYEMVKSEIDSMEIYLGELDGKHSCVCGDVEAQYFAEAEIPDAGFDETHRDGDEMYCQLKEVFESHNMNLNDEMNTVYDYIRSLDLVIDVTVRVKRSNAEKVREFASSLN